MASVASSEAWLEGPGFDLLAFFAPALLSFGAFLACVLFGVSPLLWLWLWLVAFDGPHMLAAYTRAYGDAVSWRTRRRLLLGSLLAFAVGPFVLLLGSALGNPGLFTVFLAGMSVYAFHHVVRQHWGFVALYGARSRQRPSAAERRWLYAVCWAPYVAFVLTHPVLSRQVEAGPTLERLGRWGAAGLVLLWAVGTLRYVARLGRRWQRDEPLQQSIYLLLVAGFHALLFFVVARFEPVFRGAQGLDQEFMLLGLMNGMFHSMQYVALVGLYHRRSASHVEPTWFATRPQRALWVLVPFTLIYAAVACLTGVYPGCRLWLGEQLGAGISVNQLGLALWWGFALQHYWLDERIWHVRSDPRLQQLLGLKTATPE